MNGHLSMIRLSRKLTRSNCHRNVRTAAPLFAFHWTVVVPVSNGKGFEKFYLHDGVSWTPLNSYALGLLCHKHNPYTISSNGILYVADKYMLAGKIVLCAFDTTKHNAPCLCQIKLPEFENLELENNEQIPVFMVAVADYTLCFLWHMICGDQQSPLYYAKVSITLKPASATLVKGCYRHQCHWSIQLLAIQHAPRNTSRLPSRIPCI